MKREEGKIAQGPLGSIAFTGEHQQGLLPSSPLRCPPAHFYSSSPRAFPMVTRTGFPGPMSSFLALLFGDLPCAWQPLNASKCFALLALTQHKLPEIVQNYLKGAVSSPLKPLVRRHPHLYPYHATMKGLHLQDFRLQTNPSGPSSGTQGCHLRIRARGPSFRRVRF